MKANTFASPASEIAFKLFALTGEPRYIMLFRAIEDPSLDKVQTDDREM